MTKTKARSNLEVTVPRCKKIPRGVIAPRLVAGVRGWECPTHGGIGCADRQSHLNLHSSRAAAKSDPLAVRVVAAMERYPDASVSRIRKLVDPKASPGGSRVPKLVRHLVNAGIVTRTRAALAPPALDFTLLDDECSHPETVDVLRGMHHVAVRCIECNTLFESR